MRRTHLIVLLLLVMLLGGCTFVRVQNIADVNVRVAVSVPDSNTTYTRTVSAGGINEVYSNHGGVYTVTVLPDEEYRAVLYDIQGRITQRLFEEGATLSAADVATLTARINQIDQALADLETESGASCSGAVQDFETAVVTTYWDTELGMYGVDCN